MEHMFYSKAMEAPRSMTPTTEADDENSTPEGTVQRPRFCWMCVLWVQFFRRALMGPQAPISCRPSLSI
eukprot:1196231-Prorocentrum_minimum.AAC.1